MAEQTPAGEGGSSAGRASSPEDLLTVYVAQGPRPVLVLVGPIAGEMYCLLLLNSFCISVLVKSSRQEELVVHVHSKFPHVLEVHLLILGKKNKDILGWYYKAR